MTSTLSSSPVLRYQPEIERLSQEYESRSPQELLAWAVASFGEGLILACSFGPEDLVLIDLLTQIQPAAQAFFLDTDFHFPETLELKAKVEQRYPQLRLHTYKPLFTPEEQAAEYGPELYRRNPDQCCYIRKVEPMNRALQGYQAWVTGMRRQQAATRASIGKVQWDGKRDKVKLNPLADWTDKQVWNYIHSHNLPYNVLHDRNYPSIGCFHCTAPVAPGQDPRSGRWQGTGKTECGLHT
ncbi:MAG: phosphoadenylyl-sulfate reductase [Thermostichales cyanobacterium SZTDM-1c_bins_54]